MNELLLTYHAAMTNLALLCEQDARAELIEAALKRLRTIRIKIEAYYQEK